MRSQVARRKLSSQELRNLRTLLLLNVLEPEAIGERIKQARGLRQEDLADLINVSTRTVQNYEAGDTKPYQALQDVARVTNRTVQWLLHGDPQPAAEDELAILLARLVEIAEGQEAQTEMLAELLRIVRGGPPPASTGAAGS